MPSLKEVLSSQEVMQKLLGDYSGSFSVGVIDSETPKIRLRVQGTDHQFPNSIEIDGFTYEVVLDTNFESPVAL